MIEIIPNWHPLFVHFTVGLLSIAVLLSIVVQFLPVGQLREQWQLVAQWNLWIGAGITVLTVVAGVVAYNSVAHDTPSHEAMTEHRNWALVTAAAFIVLAIWSWRRVKAGLGMSTVLLIVLLISGGLLASTAWLGGEAVYRYGLGVMSLPKTDSHDHDHGGEVGGHGSAEDQASDHPHDTAGSAGHHESKAEEDDPDNCELPEKNIQAQQSSHDNTDGHHDKLVHDNSDGHHDVKKVDDHHDDGHAH